MRSAQARPIQMGRAPFKLGAFPHRTFCACSVRKFPDVHCAKLGRRDIFFKCNVRYGVSYSRTFYAKKKLKFDAGTTAIL